MGVDFHKPGIERGGMVEMFESQDERDQAIRSFAAGKTTLATLQRNGIGNFLTVLKRLGELDLRPPLAPMDGVNADLRARGRAAIAERIARA